MKKRPKIRNKARIRRQPPKAVPPPDGSGSVSVVTPYPPDEPVAPRAPANRTHTGTGTASKTARVDARQNMARVEGVLGSRRPFDGACEHYFSVDASDND